MTFPKVCLPFNEGGLQKANLNPKQETWVWWNYNTGERGEGAELGTGLLRILKLNIFRELWTSPLQKTVFAMLDNATNALLN